MGFWDQDTKEDKTSFKRQDYFHALAKFAHGRLDVQTMAGGNERGSMVWIETSDRLSVTLDTAYGDNVTEALVRMIEHLRARVKYFRGAEALAAFDAEFDKAHPKD